MRFADAVQERMPKGLVLPDAFAAAFDWAEAKGQRMDASAVDGGDYLSIYPFDIMGTPGASDVTFYAEGLPVSKNLPPVIAARYLDIAAVAADGGTMGFWLDDAGEQHIVILDYDGWPYVLTSDPLVALQFLAIGYLEPGVIEDPTMTPAQAAEYDEMDAPILPDDFRAFLKNRFGVTPPTTAAALGIVIPDYNDMSDPMRQWLRKHMPQ